MKKLRHWLGNTVAIGLLLLVAGAGGSRVMARDDVLPGPIQIAQAQENPRGELQPRYQPAPPEEKSWYNDSYLFATTRGVANSTLVPAAKITLYPLTIVLDLALLPFAAIGGLFG